MVNTAINYCTYDDLLTGNIPLSALLLVDEIDSLFFADAPALSTGKLLSAILLLNKYRVVGMTATFRGQRGENMLKTFLEDSVILEAGTAVPERMLDLMHVYGELKL